MTFRTARPWLWLAGIAAGAMVVGSVVSIALAVLSLFSVEEPKDRPFNAAAWREWKCCESLARQNMVADLRQRLPGMSESDVVEMLGHSEVPESDSHLFRGCGRCLVYPLGLEPGLIRVDPDHLVINIVDGMFRCFSSSCR